MTKQEKRNEWYRKNGMTDQQIAEINAFDKAQKKIDNIYHKHNRSLENVSYYYENIRGFAHVTAR